MDSLNTYDYKRNGTASLFAALDVLTGKVIGQCLPPARFSGKSAFTGRRGSITAFRLDTTPTLNVVSTRPGPPTRTDTALRGESVSDQCRRPDRLDALAGRTRDLDTVAVFGLDVEHLPVEQTHFDVDRVAADLDGVELPI